MKSNIICFSYLQMKESDDWSPFPIHFCCYSRKMLYHVYHKYLGACVYKFCVFVYLFVCVF